MQLRACAYAYCTARAAYSPHIYVHEPSAFQIPAPNNHYYESDFAFELKRGVTLPYIHIYCTPPLHVRLQDAVM